MKSSSLLILFDTLLFCHVIYGDTYQKNLPVDSEVIGESNNRKHHRLDNQLLSKQETYRQDCQSNNTNERSNKWTQYIDANEGQSKYKQSQRRGSEFEDRNNIKLGSKIKEHINKITNNLNEKNESDFESDMIRNVRSTNRHHNHDSKDASNEQNRGIFGASGGISGSLGGNIGDASAGTDFGIKFNGGVGRH